MPWTRPLELVIIGSGGQVKVDRHVARARAYSIQVNTYLELHQQHKGRRKRAFSHLTPPMWHRRPSERKDFGFSCPTQKTLQGIDLEGVASRRQEARTVQLPSCGCGGQQVRDVANVPDVLRALARREVDVIQRKATSRRPFPTDALKHHASLACHVQSDGVQLPGAPSSAWRNEHPGPPVH